MNVQRARKNVQAMFPVRLPQKGGNGMIPNTLAVRMKKKHVRR